MAVLMDPLAAAVLRDALEVAATAIPRVPEPRDGRQWRFRVREGAVEILTDPEPDAEMLLGCGAALLILRLAVARLGYGSTVTLLGAGTALDTPTPVVVARLEPAEPTPATDRSSADLLAMANRRRPGRIGAAEDLARLPSDLADSLAEAARSEGADLYPVATTRGRRSLAAVLRRSARLRAGAPLRPDVADAVGSDLRATVPALVTSAGAAPADLVRAGSARERVLLTAARYGWDAVAVTQPFSRADLADALGAGVGLEPPATARALLLLAPPPEAAGS